MADEKYSVAIHLFTKDSASDIERFSSHTSIAIGKLQAQIDQLRTGSSSSGASAILAAALTGGRARGFGSTLKKTNRSLREHNQNLERKLKKDKDYRDIVEKDNEALRNRIESVGDEAFTDGMMRGKTEQRQADNAIFGRYRSRKTAQTKELTGEVAGKDMMINDAHNQMRRIGDELYKAKETIEKKNRYISKQKDTIKQLTNPNTIKGDFKKPEVSMAAQKVKDPDFEIVQNQITTDVPLVKKPSREAEAFATSQQKKKDRVKNLAIKDEKMFSDQIDLKSLQQEIRANGKEQSPGRGE